MIKAAIFDMDGVLIDSMHLWKKIVSDVIETYAESEFTEERWNKVRGMKINEIFEFWQEHFNWKEDASIETAVNKALKEMEREIKDKGEARKGLHIS